MKLQGKTFNLGVMLRREHPPEDHPRFARSAEAAGFDELWVVEDCFFGGGISSAGIALAVTESISVGLGIMPSVVRNPVFAAMEIATLARMYPGRFLPGIGHGVTSWMHQIGAMPKSQLAALEETSSVVRALLRGETVSFSGRHVHISDAKLEFPPASPPPISLGVRGIKSLQVAGRAADGTILAEFASPQYVQWARQQIATGQASAGNNTPHRLTLFVMAYFDEDTESAFAAARSLVASTLYYEDLNPHVEPLGILPQLNDLRARRALEAEMPDDWVHQLVLVGTPQQCVEGILRYVEAGVDSVVLVPPTDRSLAAPEEICDRLVQFLK